MYLLTAQFKIYFKVKGISAHFTFLITHPCIQPYLLLVHRKCLEGQVQGWRGE